MMTYCKAEKDIEIYDIILANGLSWLRAIKYVRDEKVYVVVDKKVEQGKRKIMKE